MINEDLYNKVFNQFLMRMSQIADSKSEEYQIVFQEICDVLGVAKVALDYYETLRHEKIGDCSTLVFYDSGDMDAQVVYRTREIGGNGSVAWYRVYAKQGHGEWTEDELEKIKVFATMVFIFNTRSRLTEMAEHAALYDRDLKIPNLNYFNRMASQILGSGKLSEYCSCFFNMKRYSFVNQCIGRDCATKVMVSFVKSLQEKLGENGYVARVGGDKFITLFKKDCLDIVMEHLQGQDIVHDQRTNEQIHVSASAGYYMIPEHMTVFSNIIERAHMASMSAKNNIEKSYIFYDEKLQSQKDYVNQIESLFQDALDAEEFLVYYQPKVMLNQYKLAGAEALCRWMHDGKIVPPNDFIPILEQGTGICKLDFYMLEHVCRDIRSWLNQNEPVVPISVNLSRRHMGDPDLVEKIIAIVDRYDVPHRYIEIELTETTTDVEFQDLKIIVSGLREHGIRTSVDDFGVGYSSLNLIRQVPWDVIKIDKSFLPEKVDPDSVEYIMISHLFAMMQDMGLKCIVEGVETVEQVKILKENNCYLAQGFYFDKPLPMDEFRNRLLDLREK